jgi:Rieske Fe-S protein
MQHAGHAHIVDIDQICKHLGGDVHTRQALTDPLMLIRLFGLKQIEPF